MNLKRKTLWLWLLVLLVAASVALSPWVRQGDGLPGVLVREESTPVLPRQGLDPSAGNLEVEVGSYIENLHSLSLRQRIFAAEGFYWLEWPRAVQDLLEAEKITALDMVELVNQVTASSGEVRADTPEPIARPGDRFYQLFRYSVNLYIPTVTLKRSPFEHLVLPVILEVAPDAFVSQRANVVLVDDSNSGNSQLGAYASINGYDIKAVRVSASLHSYGTDWGLESGDLDYSRLAVEVHMKSDLFSSFVSWVLPLLIVMLIVLLAPSLGGELGDVRLAIPSTALLTLIFLQQTYKAELPSLSYLTFLDCLYAYSYVVSLVLFVLFLWGTNVYAGAADEDRPAAVKRINSMDRRFQVGSLAGFFFVAILAWLI